MGNRACIARIRWDKTVPSPTPASNTLSAGGSGADVDQFGRRSLGDGPFLVTGGHEGEILLTVVVEAERLILDGHRTMMPSIRSRSSPMRPASDRTPGSFGCADGGGLCHDGLAMARLAIGGALLTLVAVSPIGSFPYGAPNTRSPWRPDSALIALSLRRGGRSDRDSRHSGSCWR